MSIEPEVEVIEQKALTLPGKAKLIFIADQWTYDRAAAFLRDVVGMRKEIQDYHSPLKQKAHEAHKAICDAESKMLKPVAEAESILKRTIGDYELEQRQIQIDLERKARAEAQKKADEERLARIEEEARLARESMERMALEANTPEELAVIQNETESVVQAARDAVKAEEPEPLAYQVPNVIYRAPGVSSVSKYQVEVESLMELVKGIADGVVPLAVIQVNQGALNKLANTLKKEFKYPGCRLREVAQVRASAGRRGDR
jgi:hypothetical protein